MPLSKLGLLITVEGERAAIQAMSQVDRATNKAARGMEGVGQGLGKLGGQITSVGRTIAQSGLALTFGLTVPLAMAGKELVEAGIEFEDTFAGIAKTIEGVAEVGADGTLVLTDMGEQLKEMVRTMALDMPIAATELNKIGQIAGQLGVRGTENLQQYIDTVAKMGVATDLSTEEAAFGFARLANIMGIASEDVGEYAESMGAAIVHLGNTTASTEPEILNLTMRIAGAGRVAGLSTPEILGFASAAAQLGVPAERGGTAVSRIFQEMGFAVGQGVETINTAIQSIPEEFRDSADQLTRDRTKLAQQIATTELMGLQGFGEYKPFETQSQYEGQLSSLQLKLQQTDAALASIDGVTTSVTASITKSSDALAIFAEIANQGTSEASIGAQEFADIFENDAIRATELFISGMAKMQEEGTLTEEMLTEIGMSGVRVRDTINRFGGSADFATGEIKILRDAVEASNKAFKEQEALNAEAEKRFATFRSQIQLVKNAFFDLGITLFDLVKDDFKIFLDSIINLVGWFKNLDRDVQTTILTILGIAAAIGPALVVIGGLVVAIGSVVTALGGLISMGPLAIAAILGIGGAVAGIGGTALSNMFDLDIKDLLAGVKASLSSAPVEELDTGETPAPVSGVNTQREIRTAQRDAARFVPQNADTVGTADFRAAEAEEELTPFKKTLLEINQLLLELKENLLAPFQNEAFKAAMENVRIEWENLKTAFNDAAGGAVTFGDVLAFIAGLIGNVLAILIGVFAIVLTLALQLFTGIIKGIDWFVEIAIPAIGDFIQGIIDFFVDLYNKIVGNSIWTDLWQTMLDQVTNFTGDILDKIITWKDNIVNAFNSLKDSIFGVVDKIKDKLDDIAEAAQNVLGKITGSPELKLQHTFEAFEDYLQGADFGFNLQPSMNPAVGGGTNINNSRVMENNFTFQGMPMDNARSMAGEMMNQLRIMETVGG